MGHTALRWPVNAEGLTEADLVVALWSDASVSSIPIVNAATQAACDRKLVSVRVGHAEPPAAFALVKLHELAAWRPGSVTPELKNLVDHIQGMVGAPAIEAPRRAAAGDRNNMVIRLGQYQDTSNAHARPRPAPQARSAPQQPQVEPLRQAQPVAAEQPKPAPKPAAPRPAPPTEKVLAEEAAFWMRIRYSKSASDFVRYLELHGEDGAFAELARQRLRMIERNERLPDEREQQPKRRAKKSGGFMLPMMALGGLAVLGVGAFLLENNKSLEVVATAPAESEPPAQPAPAPVKIAAAPAPVVAGPLEAPQAVEPPEPAPAPVPPVPPVRTAALEPRAAPPPAPVVAPRRAEETKAKEVARAPRPRPAPVVQTVKAAQPATPAPEVVANPASVAAVDNANFTSGDGTFETTQKWQRKRAVAAPPE
jgi:outer membrane biosynthesis protein TonB